MGELQTLDLRCPTLGQFTLYTDSGFYLHASTKLSSVSKKFVKNTHKLQKT